MGLYGFRNPRGRLLAAMIVVILLLWAGYWVRAWTFRHTWPIRFSWDLDNAWSKGSAAIELGKGEFFGGIVEAYKPARSIYIDYAPGRMYVKTAWVWLIRHVHGDDVRRSDQVMYPMLAFNFCFEILGALGMYRLCRLFGGRAVSLLAACCLWFNPGVIYNTSGWVQWDVWMIAPLLWAAWATLRRGRLAGNLVSDLFAGLCLGLGAMLKGQILLGVAWFPLMAMGMSLSGSRPFNLSVASRWQRHILTLLEAATRVVLQAVGFVLAVAIVTLPFSLRGSDDWLRVFQSEVTRELPMDASAWNLPGVLAARYGLESTSLWAVGLFRWSVVLPVMQWLEYGFVGWMILICLLSIRARNHRHVLLALPAIYTAAFAVLPGMHERYVLWGAAPLAAAVCVGPAATIVSVVVAGLALGCPLRVCLGTNPAFAPKLKCFLDVIDINGGWLWLACAIGLTVLLAQTPAPSLHRDLEAGHA